MSYADGLSCLVAGAPGSFPAPGTPSAAGSVAPVSEDDEMELMDEQLLMMLDRQKEVRRCCDAVLSVTLKTFGMSLRYRQRFDSAGRSCLW